RPRRTSASSSAGAASRACPRRSAPWSRCCAPCARGPRRAQACRSRPRASLHASMPAVIAKIVYALAGVALAFSLVGLQLASHDVAHESVVLPGGVPAVVWEPALPLPFGETPSFDPPAPVVILCHGIA